MRYHADVRAQRFCNLFSTPGDVNLFIVNPGQRTCWHRHQKQTDQFRVIRGALRFGRWKEKEQAWYTVLDRPEQDLTVLPGWWHGYANEGTEPAYLLMYLNRRFDPLDEERLSEAEQPWLVV